MILADGWLLMYQQHNGVVEYVAVRIDFIGFQDRFLGGGFDAADKMFFLFLPLIKSTMGLVSTVGNASLPRRKDHADKRPLSAVAVGKEHLSWNAMVQVKPEMDLGLF